MKTLIRFRTVIATLFFGLSMLMSYAQNSGEILEARANDMHKALLSESKSDWEAFIKSNYSSKFLENYEMSRHLEMFEQLHQNLAASKISTLKIKPDMVIMEVERKSDQEITTLELRCDTEDEYKINGINVDVGEL